MSENQKNTMGNELDSETMDQVVGGIYMKDQGACPHCHTPTNGEWSEELQKVICPHCHWPIGQSGLGVQVQGVI